MKIATEAKLDGKYLLSTSDPGLSAEDVALGSKNLLAAERGFRDLKSSMELRPVFHRLEPRIRPRAALLAGAAADPGRGTTHGQTWHTIARELGRLHAITLVGRPAWSSKPPNRRPPSRAFCGPADSPHRPGLPPSTL